MTHCPTCQRQYGDDVKLCAVDGTTLRSAGPAQDRLVGRTLNGRYRVTKRVGRGGMGTVYIAEQISIGRAVALKVLNGDFADDDEFVRRFRDEARAIAAVRHPNVIVVYDYDREDEGGLFIAMEYVEGFHLGELIRRERFLDVPRAMTLALQIGEGLHAAHRAGVIHRDVKPQNIMLVGGEDDVKLMDFGIARLRQSGRTLVTAPGMMMGSPNYMAPEQILGGEVTEATDVYALGVVVHEMLAGTAPFAAPTVDALLAKHLHERPPALRQIRGDIPPALEDLVLKALEKNPDERHRDMAEMIQSLRLVAASDGSAPVGSARAGSETTLVRTRVALPAPEASPAVDASSQAVRLSGAEHWTTRRWMVTATVLSTILLAVAIGWSAYYRIVPTEQPPAAPVSTARDQTPVNRSASPREVAGPGLEASGVAEADGEGTERAQAAADRQRADAARVPEGRRMPPRQQPRPQQPPPMAPAREPAERDPARAGAVRTRAQVEEKLRTGGLLKSRGSEWGVTVEATGDGVITLTGVLRDGRERDETIRLARGVSGVTEVRQRINIRESWQPPPS